MQIRKITYTIEEFFKELKKETYFSMKEVPHKNPSAVIECALFELSLGEFFSDSQGNLFIGEDKLTAVKQYRSNEFVFNSSLFPECDKLKYSDLTDRLRNLLSDTKITIQVLPSFDDVSVIKELIKQRES